MKDNNPLLCDPESGFCGIPAAEDKTVESAHTSFIQKPIHIIYYTDPICSACWAIEPQLRKLKLEYGHVIDIEYKMGGLLPDWSYNSGGISKPSDVAHHWHEVSIYYDMPIDGDIWLEDPLPSSYPPSIAFKAAQMQSSEKALLFLRNIREMVFLEKKNISRWEYLETAAKTVALNTKQFKNDYEGKAKELFNDDLKLGRELGVRGFPTLFFINSYGKTEIVYGSKPYAAFENAILRLLPLAIKNNYDKSWKAIFQNYQSLTAKEFSELVEMNRNAAENLLNELAANEMLSKFDTKNGSIWTIKDSRR